jgi:hypothetical protein
MPELGKDRRTQNEGPGPLHPLALQSFHQARSSNADGSSVAAAATFRSLRLRLGGTFRSALWPGATISQISSRRWRCGRTLSALSAL